MPFLKVSASGGTAAFQISDLTSKLAYERLDHEIQRTAKDLIRGFSTFWCVTPQKKKQLVALGSLSCFTCRRVVSGEVPPPHFSDSLTEITVWGPKRQKYPKFRKTKQNQKKAEIREKFENANKLCFFFCSHPSIMSRPLWFTWWAFGGARVVEYH